MLIISFVNKMPAVYNTAGKLLVAIQLLHVAPDLFKSMAITCFLTGH